MGCEKVLLFHSLRYPCSGRTLRGWISYRTSRYFPDELWDRLVERERGGALDYGTVLAWCKKFPEKSLASWHKIRSISSTLFCWRVNRGIAKLPSKLLAKRILQDGSYTPVQKVLADTKVLQRGLAATDVPVLQDL